MASLLANTQHCVQVVTNHKNLVYFSITRILNQRQARWSTFLADYDFEIVFHPGAQHGKEDALSRRSEFEIPTINNHVFYNHIRFNSLRLIWMRMNH